MNIAIEAHVVQYGKLMRNDGGGVADSQEHAITSCSRGCPKEIARSASDPIRWLPEVSYPQQALPPQGASVLAARYLKDARQRAWLLFTHIEQRYEHVTQGRPYVRSRTLALAADDADGLWWLPFGVINALAMTDDLASEPGERRRARETVWIKQPPEATRVEAGEAPQQLYTRFRDYIAGQIQPSRTSVTAEGPTLAGRLDGHRMETVAWGIGLASRGPGLRAVTPYIIGINASEQAVTKAHRITFTG